MVNLAETQPYTMNSVPRFYEKLLAAVQAAGGEVGTPPRGGAPRPVRADDAHHDTDEGHEHQQGVGHPDVLPVREELDVLRDGVVEKEGLLLDHAETGMPRGRRELPEIGAVRHDPAGAFHPAPDYPLELESLVGVDRQKDRFVENLKRFLDGEHVGAEHHALAKLDAHGPQIPVEQQGALQSLQDRKSVV